MPARLRPHRCVISATVSASNDMKRLLQWIRAGAINSGHPDMVFAFVAVVVATFLVFVLRGIFG